MQDRDEQRQPEREREQTRQERRQSSSSGSSVPRTATVTMATSANTTANVMSWTVTTDAGIVSRGNRTLRTSAPWSMSDGAAPSSDCEKKIHTTSPTIRNSG